MTYQIEGACRKKVGIVKKFKKYALHSLNLFYHLIIGHSSFTLKILPRLSQSTEIQFFLASDWMKF